MTTPEVFKKPQVVAQHELQLQLNSKASNNKASGFTNTNHSFGLKHGSYPKPANQGAEPKRLQKEEEEKKTVMLNDENMQRLLKSQDGKNQIIKTNALKGYMPLQQLPANPRNGRPHLMVLSGNLHKRIEVLRFASRLNQDRAS